MIDSITDTPSPPRVKHAEGPSRYEKELMNLGEQREDTGPKAIGEWRLGKTVGKGASGKFGIGSLVLRTLADLIRYTDASMFCLLLGILS
jgi:hypothetical protein